jgi:hypothetical protein
MSACPVTIPVELGSLFPPSWGAISNEAFEPSVDTAPKPYTKTSVLVWGLPRSSEVQPTYHGPELVVLEANSGETRYIEDIDPRSLFFASEEKSISRRIEMPVVRIRDRATEQKFKLVMQRGKEEQFEDGMESRLSKDLEILVKGFGPDSKDILSRLLEDESISSLVWAEAMRWIGRAEEFMSRSSRLSLLKQALSSDSFVVRDGAALGLASMDDPDAIPFLERAVASETVNELRADMRQVLEQLRGR